jgi:hypothetical protein
LAAITLTFPFFEMAHGESEALISLKLLGFYRNAPILA